jgi:hypothetical protein
MESVVSGSVDAAVAAMLALESLELEIASKTGRKGGCSSGRSVLMWALGLVSST